MLLNINEPHYPLMLEQTLGVELHYAGKSQGDNNRNVSQNLTFPIILGYLQ